jgi:hypothetical protein
MKYGIVACGMWHVAWLLDNISINTKSSSHLLSNYFFSIVVGYNYSLEHSPGILLYKTVLTHCIFFVGINQGDINWCVRLLFTPQQKTPPAGTTRRTLSVSGTVVLAIISTLSAKGILLLAIRIPLSGTGIVLLAS